MYVFVIKKLRERKNMSINKLAKITGISRSYIIELENNKKTNPTMATLRKIAEALDVNIKELFYSELEISKLKEEMYQRIDKFGIGSAEALQVSQILDLLINLEMEKED